jgi:hypothetical protein
MNKFYTLNSKSLETEGVASYAELWEKVKSSYKGLQQVVPTSFEKMLGEEGQELTNFFKVTMSTGMKDRHGEIVYQNWDLENFKKNPVFLDSHNYGSIEHIIGKVHNAQVDNGRLVGEVEFAIDNPKGYLAMRLAQGGFLSATSVGFIPLAFDADGNITKAELLEDSAVSVPANAEALFERSIKSIEEADEVIEEVIEQDGGFESEPESGTDTETENTENTEEVTEEEATVEVKSETSDTYAVLIKRLQTQTNVMKAVAKQLQDTKPTTLAERKRKILRDLRQVI